MRTILEVRGRVELWVIIIASLFSSIEELPSGLLNGNYLLNFLFGILGNVNRKFKLIDLAWERVLGRSS